MNEDILHLRPAWQKVAARMQHEARKTQGYAVVSIQILVNGDGNPIVWFEPTMRRIEPRQCDELAKFLTGLT